MPFLSVRFRAKDQWEAENPILGDDELGIEAVAVEPDGTLVFELNQETGQVQAKYKRGQDQTIWNTLPYEGLMNLYEDPGLISSEDFALVKQTADGAWTAAGQAVEKAGQAVEKAGQALAATEYFQGNVTAINEMATAAKTNAEKALVQADDAETAGRAAEEKAETAKEQAQSALETADKAMATADRALSAAGSAGGTDAGVFQTEDEPINADEVYDYATRKYLLNPESLNFPVEAPLYFEVVINSGASYDSEEGNTSVTQRVWQDPEGTVWARLGQVDRSGDEGGDPVISWAEWVASGGMDLALKADLASPAFTGVPTAPTAVSTDNSTQIATTAFVKANIGSGVNGIQEWNDSTSYKTNDTVFVDIPWGGGVYNAVKDNVNQHPLNEIPVKLTPRTGAPGIAGYVDASINHVGYVNGSSSTARFATTNSDVFAAPASIPSVSYVYAIGCVNKYANPLVYFMVPYYSAGIPLRATDPLGTWTQPGTRATTTDGYYYAVDGGISYAYAVAGRSDSSSTGTNYGIYCTNPTAASPTWNKTTLPAVSTWNSLRCYPGTNQGLIASNAALTYYVQIDGATMSNAFTWPSGVAETIPGYNTHVVICDTSIWIFPLSRNYWFVSPRLGEMVQVNPLPFTTTAAMRFCQCIVDGRYFMIAFTSATEYYFNAYDVEFLKGWQGPFSLSEAVSHQSLVSGPQFNGSMSSDTSRIASYNKFIDATGLTNWLRIAS